MRYVIYGAGAIGGIIGGRLFQAGHDVVLLARGDHLDSLRERGLELQTPADTAVLRIRAEAGPEDAGISDDDVVVLAMKGQDTVAAVERLAGIGRSPAIVCAQNGVENERVALRQFPYVYGMAVMLPATHLAPGVVQAHSAATIGILDLGRYPEGVDDRAEAVAADLTGGGFSSRADPAIMRRKYAKLLMNLGNALEAASGDAGRRSDLFHRARQEARRCFDAAGIDYASAAEDAERRGDLIQVAPVAGQRRGGGSSWQTLARSTGRIETDYLNGEVVLLGRLHGIATPVNEMLQQVATRMARGHEPPGSIAVADLEAMVR